MGYDLELPMAYMRRDLLEKYSEEEMKKFREEFILWAEEEKKKMAREKMARDELINAKMEDYIAEEMKMIAKEKMVGRRRERLMRQSLRRRQTAIQKNSKPAEESFTSDSADEEMKIALEEVKRLMEENMTAARDEVGDAAKKEDFKAEEMNNTTNDDGDAAKKEEDEKMFPRRRGRLIRYLRRQRSTSQDSAFQIEFQPPESLMSYSDESDEMNNAELVDRERINEAQDNNRSVLMGKQMHDSPSAALSKTNFSDAVDISEESEVSGSDKEDSSWISWFCNLRGNKFLCEVDDYYILDDFNLCGLSHQVPYYDYALDLILDEESSSHGEVITEEQNELIESAAEMLYGMIHARYILTGNGFNSMSTKYKNYDFGRCPKVYCRGQPCLPVGLSDIPRASTVKIYCPKCEDVYYPPSKYQGNIDGAFFGTTFSHLFVMTWNFMMPEKVSQSYVPRVFGFKLHKP